jgi:hypothetical protein
LSALSRKGGRALPRRAAILEAIDRDASNASIGSSGVEDGMKPLIVGALVLGIAAPEASTQLPKYGVKATVDKDTDFSRLRTYAWTTGWSAFRQSVDRQIVAAIDRELTNRGFVKLESQPSDVLVTYAAVQRTDVDLKSKPTGSPAANPSFPVGTVVVLLLEPTTGQELFRVKGDAPLGRDPGAIGLDIDSLVARMFEKYPKRKAKH